VTIGEKNFFPSTFQTLSKEKLPVGLHMFDQLGDKAAALRAAAAFGKALPLADKIFASVMEGDLIPVTLRALLR
jgi:hypothetical protein